MKKKLHVALLAGGLSSEREVSLRSGEKVAEALKSLGHQVRIYDPATDLRKIINERDWVDVVFPALHGKYGEDGTIQGFLELLDLPYVGSGVLASALAIDKLKSVDVYRAAGLPTARSFLIAGSSVDCDRVETEIGFPCVIKPVTNGSSIGVEIVDKKEHLSDAYRRVRKLEDRVMIEEYISGREITVGVIGNEESKALPVLEIKPKSRFFDYDAKYNGETEEVVPDDIDTSILKKAQDYAVLAHKILGCRGLSRTDFIVRDKEVIVLETNTMPGMTSESLLPKADMAAGVTFPELIEQLLELSLEGKNGLAQK
ncbi:MAG: D-alanine--D-alanine ligase [bacterium]|nr:D-alanine--D-alanine ligase [bacterium]